MSRDISVRRQHELEMQRARQANEALQAANAKLERMSATDPLTGAWNRRHFEREIAAAVARAQRQDCSLSVVMLDHFNQVNDRYDHPAVLSGSALRVRLEMSEVRSTRWVTELAQELVGVGGSRRCSLCPG